ncbi:MAG: hydroxyacid dehydrogenase [Spirochaetes bacterium]|nr:MAG: hydroxyacid dehydrogenase [Spirochaetota bacterium]
MEVKDSYILLPQPIEEEAVLLLKKAGIKVVIAPDPKPETVAPLMKKAKGIILRTGIKITSELISKAEDLWTISRTGAGVDNVDVTACSKEGIIVTSSIGANSTSVAEHTISLILALFKQLFLMDKEVRRGNFGIRYKNLPKDLRGKILGVVGFGKIGSLVAKSCYDIFDMKIIAFDPILPEEIKKRYIEWVKFLSLEELLKEADVVSIHIPLNKDTKGFIDLEKISLMKPDAFIVNTSRGGVIKEKDLIKALQDRIIAGAGLDVFEKEPIDKNNPLLAMDNVILTPHSAALTKECVVRMATEAAKRVIDLFNGYIPEHIVNPEVLSMEKWKFLKNKQS